MNDRFSSRDKHYDKLLGKTLTQLLSILYLFITRKEFLCKSCQHMWHSFNHPQTVTNLSGEFLC